MAWRKSSVAWLGAPEPRWLSSGRRAWQIAIGPPLRIAWRGCGPARRGGADLPQLVASPLRPIEEALLDLTRDIPPPQDAALSPFIAVLGTLIPHWQPAGWRPPNESLVMIGEAIFRLLRAVSGRRGLLVVLEDLQWADDATVAVVRFLADHIPIHPSALLVTVRTGEVVGTRHRFLEPTGARNFSLGRLSIK